MNKLLIALLCASMACGGGSKVAFTLRDPSGSVTQAPANGARLEAAQRQLVALVGHPLRIEIDAALLPTSVAAFTDAYADAVEAVIGTLTSLRDRQPDTFAQLGQRVQKIELRYDGTLERAEGTFAGDTVTVRASAAQALPELRGALFFALADRYQEHEGRAIYALDPRKVPADQQSAYFDALVHYSDYEPKPSARPSWDPEGTVVRFDPRGRALQKAVAFHAAVAPGVLRSKLEERIVSEGNGYVAEPFRRYTRAVGLAAPTDSVVRQTQKAYLGWLQKNLSALPEKLQHKVALAAFSRDEETAKDAFAGFDRLGFGLALYDRWLAQKEPVGSFDLLDDTVCPFDNNGDKPERSRSCVGGLYRAALATDADLSRFASFVRQKDSRVVINTFANLRTDHEPRTFDLFRALDELPQIRNVAARTIGDLYARDARWENVVRREGYDLYRRRVDARGAALYMVLSTRPYGGFAAVMAGTEPKIGAAELQDLLAISPKALDFFSEGWGALPFAKARVITAALSPSAKTETLIAIARAACAEGKPSEIGELRRGMENAARSAPTERARYDAVLELLRTCPPQKP